MKLSSVSALLMPLALAGVALAGPLARAEGDVKRQAGTPQVFKVTVSSANNALSYNPSSIKNANIGDIVTFSLADGAPTHTVTQAVDGTNPCTPAAGGLDHTFDPSIPSSLVTNVTITFAGPFHAFDKLQNNCQAGMTFTTNA